MDTDLICFSRVYHISSFLLLLLTDPPLAMDIFILLVVCTILSVSINGSSGTASAFVSDTPIIKRVSLSKFERFATNINSENHMNDINIHQYNRQSNVFTSRRSFVSSSVTIASTILYHPNHNANADELNNLHYKSKADGDEDPLAVFGKSLENMGTDSANGSDVSSTKDTSLSFNDISLPQSTDDISSQPPPDLNKALKERKDSQKRSVDPRTHG